MRSKSVLVTGGAGFIGSNLVDFLSRDNHVVVIDDLSAGKKENLAMAAGSVEFVEGSITDKELVAKLVRDKDYVFHLAAIASVPLCQKDPVGTARVNVGGTRNVLESAKSAGAKVVFSSSCAVYGDSTDMPLKESAEAKPISEYGKMKREAELACTQKDGVALRYFNVYGPRQDPHSEYSAVIPIFATRILKREAITIYGSGEATRDFVHVSDVVRANILAAESKDANGRCINIGTGKPTSINSLAQMLMELAGKNVEVKHMSHRPGDILESYGDISLAHKLLGYKPETDMERGLGDLLSHYVRY